MPDMPRPEMLGDAQDAVIVHERAAIVVEVNEEACRSLGYTREELVGKHVREIVVGLDDAALRRMTDALRRRGFVTVRAVHRRKDGSRFPVETRLALLRRNGPPLVVAFARDLSVQEAAQRALQSEKRYRSLVEMLPDGVVTYQGGRIAFANPAAARLVGVDDPRHLIGMQVLEWTPPSRSRSCASAWRGSRPGSRSR